MAATAAFAGKDAQSLKNDPAFSDMRRWGDGDRLLERIERIRALAPDAALRSNVKESP